MGDDQGSDETKKDHQLSFIKMIIDLREYSLISPKFLKYRTLLGTNTGLLIYIYDMGPRTFPTDGLLYNEPQASRVPNNRRV
jgi:hypothetical protein